jgi:hypothetical protein
VKAGQCVLRIVLREPRDGRRLFFTHDGALHAGWRVRRHRRIGAQIGRGLNPLMSPARDRPTRLATALQRGPVTMIHFKFLNMLGGSIALPIPTGAAC